MREYKTSKKIKCLNNGIIYASQHAAARDLGLDASSISKVVRGIIKTTKGFRFELAAEDEEITFIED